MLFFLKKVFFYDIFLKNLHLLSLVCTELRRVQKCLYLESWWEGEKIRFGLLPCPCFPQCAFSLFALGPFILAFLHCVFSNEVTGLASHPVWWWLLTPQHLGGML